MATQTILTAFNHNSASSLAGSPMTVGSASSSVGRAPVLYSAIGSLEDPATSSLPKVQAKVSKAAIADYPANVLIPPLSLLRRQFNPDSENAATHNNPASSILSVGVLMPKKSDDTNHKVSTLSQKLTALEDTSTSTGPSASPNTPPAKFPDVDSGAKFEHGDAVSDEQQYNPDGVPTKLPSSLRTGERRESAKSGERRKVRISDKKRPKELFRPSSDAYTPRIEKKKDLKYKPKEERTSVLSGPMGTLHRPNFRDALRRVAMIVHQHIVKIERRFEPKNPNDRPHRIFQRRSDGLFLESMRDAFSEDKFVTPKYKCTMVRVPMARPGNVFGLKRVRQRHKIPMEKEIFEFAHQLFDTVQLSSECSIVCLIYVERLMEQAKVPLLSCSWRPIFMCGLLLASKVWQDLSSWNIEFASVYPQFSLDAINRLEIQFLKLIKWDLYISTSLYAKYYFALRSVVEKPDFRNRYNRMVAGVNNVQASEARKVEEGSVQAKENALLQLSRSM